MLAMSFTACRKTSRDFRWTMAFVWILSNKWKALNFMVIHSVSKQIDVLSIKYPSKLSVCGGQRGMKHTCAPHLLPLIILSDALGVKKRHFYVTNDTQPSASSLGTSLKEQLGEKLPTFWCLENQLVRTLQPIGSVFVDKLAHIWTMASDKKLFFHSICRRKSFK